MNNSSIELYHHGVQGQKWGVQNGPPYPLDYNDHSESEKKHSRINNGKQFIKYTGKNVGLIVGRTSKKYFLKGRDFVVDQAKNIYADNQENFDNIKNESSRMMSASKAESDIKKGMVK